MCDGQWSRRGVIIHLVVVQIPHQLDRGDGRHQAHGHLVGARMGGFGVVGRMVRDQTILVCYWCCSYRGGGLDWDGAVWSAGGLGDRDGWVVVGVVVLDPQQLPPRSLVLSVVVVIVVVRGEIEVG